MSSLPQQLPQDPIAQNPPAYTLFDSNAVGLATFLGTPVAGATLMAVNDSRIGRGARGIFILLGTTLVTALVIFLGWNIPQGFDLPISLVLLFAMKGVAKAMQGAAITNHVQRGGPLGSRWTAFWVALAFLVVIFGGIFLAVYIPAYKAENGPKVGFGTKDDVYYTGSATQADAQAVGKDLKDDGYFQDQGADVTLDKGNDGTVLSFIVKEGFWNQTSNVTAFEEIGREIAPDIGGFPIKLRLLDKERETKVESTIGKATFSNKDHVFYLGSATDAQAEALGQALQIAGFFTGKGTDVFLAKHSDGTVLSFITADGVWDEPETVAEFEKIARQAAHTIGGLPIHMRLLNSTLVVKKDEALQ